MAEGETLSSESSAIAAFDSQRNIVTIHFNDPRKPAIDGPEYDLPLTTNLRSTLESVKADIAR